MSTARFFSGKNIWLRKKAVKSLGGAAVTSTFSTLATVVGNEGLSDTSNRSHGPISCIIGWDEARGRPVYRCSTGTKPGGSVDKNHELKDVENLNDKDSPTSLVDHNSLWNERSRKRKVFGGDRRLRPLTGLLTTARSSEKENLPSLNENCSGGCYLDRSSMACIGSVISTTVGNSQQQCEEADVAHAIQPSHRLQSLAGVEDEKYQTEVTRRVNDEDQFEFDDTDPINQATVSCKRIKRVANPATLSSASCNDQNALLNSLDTARTFFEKLAEHRLTLDASDTPKQLNKRPCCRTRRVRRLSSPNLTGEYNRYVQACRESDVSPLPKKEYAANRGEYFRSNEVYDGFLDE